MKTIYGDTTGTLSKYKTGKSQYLPDYDGNSTQSYTIFGDARYITDHARGGHDYLIGFWGRPISSTATATACRATASAATTPSP